MGRGVERNSFTLGGLRRIVLFRQFGREVSLCDDSLFGRRSVQVSKRSGVSAAPRDTSYIKESMLELFDLADNFNEKQINKSTGRR